MPSVGKYYQGRYRPENPQKYRGDAGGIIYRSSWELKCMRRFDMDPSIIEWSSEEVIIPYINPADQKQHRYFVDFWIKYKKKDGSIREALVEVKPKSQTAPPAPNKSGRVTERYIKEVYTYVQNQSKWQFAKAYCDSRGWEFIILTEDNIGVK